MKSSQGKPSQTRSSRTRLSQNAPSQSKRPSQDRASQPRRTPIQAPSAAMKDSEIIYSLHAVRVMLERHPERVNAVRIAERRDDPRVRENDKQTRQNDRPV